MNKDKKLVETLKCKLKDSGGYCPCAVIYNDDTKCMCKEFRESNKSGYCHCGLYYKDMGA